MSVKGLVYSWLSPVVILLRGKEKPADLNLVEYCSGPRLRGVL
jgi:hypothetical protein